MSASARITVRPELSRDDWKRLNRLLAQALEVDADARAGWIALLPESERDLLPVLEQLQAANAVETAEFMPHLRSDALPHLAQPGGADRDERPGAQVGPYRLLRELGVGGMGSVWLAERIDGAFERQVALKLPRAEWTDRGLNERMARERNALASLNHPNVAQMYDAGWAGDGRPYLALEHVEGQTIDAWCRDRKLDVPARLKLFVDVVRAVAFAHAKLVIHRDLKPSNVLVTAEGRVKLLDFGIAKLLSADAALAEETALTRVSGRALTLSYAAPEQVLGQPISTAADTYSLGVMLYELLSGKRPYVPTRESRGALEEAIVNVDPPAPSSVAVDKAAARALRGDLDTILLKALRKLPEQRYETTAAFADDLERWLDGKPVRAQRDSAWYRARRFLARHRVTVTVAGAAASALLIGGGVALWQFHTAGEESARADMVRDFVLSIIAQADPAAAGETREADLTLLTTAESRIAKELAGRPALALELRLAIAKAYRHRGEFRRAGDTLRKAIAEATPVLPASDPLLARAWIENAEWHSSESLAVAPELDRAIETMRQRGKEGAEAAIEGLQLRARLRRWTGRQQDADADLRDAHALAIKYFGESDPRALRVALRLQHLADDPLALTERAYRTALANADLQRSAPVFLEIQAAYGHQLCCATGRGREGLRLLHATVDAARKHHGAGSATAVALGSLATGLSCIGDAAGAYETIRETYALAVARAPEGSVHRGVMANTVLNFALRSRRIDNLAPIVKEAGREKANADWQQARLVWLKNFEGDAIGAAALAPRAIEIANQRAWPWHVSEARLAWSYALRQSRRPEQARDVLEPLAQESDPRVLKERAAVQLALGNAEAALATAETAIKEESESMLQTNPDLSDLQLTRGQALLKLGRAEEALAAFRVSDEFWRSYEPTSPWAAEAQYWHGRALIATGDAVRGRQWVREMLPRLAKSHMPSHRALAASTEAAR